jgi:hypothetical protein
MNAMLARSRHAETRTTLAPSPLMGEGWGEGESLTRVDSASITPILLRR